MIGKEQGKKLYHHYPDLSKYFLQAGHCAHDEVPDQVNSIINKWVTNNC
ncbi:hypothetical protein ACE1CI_01220 [Aerosakkonemataceae cyanobacterium BLCC-F50]|uniref:Uncharacterized protein n=1 Tax=Floridaenema flaviceps BLCC-F50 TaxID=3153642 RepID=A0ABV4XJY4_9CYAN